MNILYKINLYYHSPNLMPPKKFASEFFLEKTFCCNFWEFSTEQNFDIALEEYKKMKKIKRLEKNCTGSLNISSTILCIRNDVHDS